MMAQAQPQAQPPSGSRFRNLLRRVVFNKKKTRATGDDAIGPMGETPSVDVVAQLSESTTTTDSSTPHVDKDDNVDATGTAADASAQPNDGDEVDVLVDLNQTDADRLLAEFVQVKVSKEVAEQQMMETKTGKAYKFVQAVLDLHESMVKSDSATTPGGFDISTVALDEMVWFVERMLAKQDEFKAAGMDTAVDIGYHYTKDENLERIRTDGLLSKQERSDRSIDSKHNGSAYGDGIYTCNDPMTYRGSYGPVCLLVARLKGATASVISNATYTVGSLVVLRSAAQCVPLLQILSEPDDLIRQYHDKLQSLIDEYFNAEATVLVVPISRDKTLRYDAPVVLNGDAMGMVSELASQEGCDSDDCCICLHALESQKLGQIQGCGHVFHYQCIAEAVAHSSRCPLCATNLVEPQGTMPDGTMDIAMEPSITCGGYAPGTIKITYSIGSGIQKPYHR